MKMPMNNTIKNLNKLVLSVLQGEAKMEATWMGAKNQGALKNLVSKSLKNTKKDPNAPKRGKSTYLFFCATTRDTVKNSLPADAKATDVTRELGIRWNLLKEDLSRSAELQKYEKLAAQDKERYVAEKKNYVSPNVNELVGKGRKVSQGPKRAKSAYLYFCSANRSKVHEELGEDSSATNITRELGLRWNKAKANNTVAEFVQLAEQDKKRYFQEKDAAANVSNKQVDVSPPVVAKAPAKKAPAKKAPAPAKKVVVVEELVKDEAPTPKKVNGYQSYCAQNREKFRKHNPKDVTKKLSAAWKALSVEEQNHYKSGSVSSS